MEVYKLDETDYKILRVLQQDGLATYKHVGDKILKSVNPTAERIKRLYKLGYIKSTVAVVDLNKLGPTLTVFPLINLTNHSEMALTQFQEAIMGYPEVMECYRLSGSYDFKLKVMTPNMATYDHFITHKIGKMPNVGAIHSLVAQSEIKREIAYPFL